MNKLFLVFHYVRYFFKARNEHWLHSPFVYELYTKVIKEKKQYADFEKIEGLRIKLKQNQGRIEIKDLGAGSGINKSTLRSISSICRHSEKSPALAQLLYRIVKDRKPAILLDLGTSLGLTTLYEATANPAAKVYTFEGCPNTAALAVQHFKQLSVSTIETVVGNIDVTLPEVLSNVPAVDFVFFDANHRYEPTMNYFRLCLEKAQEESVFIFDDIYWSPGMKKAWDEIKMHPSIGISIDLFFIGIVFLRKKQPVQHFTLR